MLTDLVELVPVVHALGTARPPLLRVVEHGRRGVEPDSRRQVDIKQIRGCAQSWPTMSHERQMGATHLHAVSWLPSSSKCWLQP